MWKVISIHDRNDTEYIATVIITVWQIPQDVSRVEIASFWAGTMSCIEHGSCRLPSTVLRLTSYEYVLRRTLSCNKG